MMKRALLATLICAKIAFAGDSWRVAEPGWNYAFPRDHHAHTEFKTEWWYFTGNLIAQDGKRFGYELTFFREGVRPPEARIAPVSRFVVNDLKFAHFAVTDVANKRFIFEQKTARGAFGEAGFDDGDRLAWIDDWSLKMLSDGVFEICGSNRQASVRFIVRSAKPPAIHGAEGVSRKGAGTENASHYYSLTRMETTGEIAVGGISRKVHGESWFDHEWATNQLAANQVGWDWLSVQFDNGTELMLYRLRLANGTVDAESSGTIVDANGTTMHLSASDFEMKPTRVWKSATGSATYPVEWRISVSKLDAQFTVRPVIDTQELAFKPLMYWEGAIDVAGEQAGKRIAGRGYLELTGYAAPLRELAR